MLKNKQGSILDIKNCREIAAGGEGKILEHPSNKNRVLKIYHQPRKSTFAAHLESLSHLSDVFIKPIDVYYNAKGEVAGFDMRYINFNDYNLFNNLFNKGFCSSNSITKDFKIRLLDQLKAALQELHKTDIVVGDLNMYNLFFSLKGELLFVDVDSYQTKTQPHSGVLLDEIRDWTTTKINKETDIWAYDILSFWTTTFVHPFKWVAPGNKDTLEQRVKQGKSILTKIPNIKIPALYEAPAPEPEKQFKEIFSGRRYFVDFGNSVVSIPVVIRTAISSTALTIRELFEHVTEVNVCADYIVVKRNNEWISVETKIPKVTRELLPSSIQMYPSNSKVVYVVGNTLKHSAGSIDFIKPEFFYYNGFLSVIDYATDLQYNFNLNNQLGGIDYTQTPVFAKSIVIRDTPIQNFGGKKYINIPVGNRYSLLEVPFGTKNAHFHDGVIVAEYTENNQAKFRIFKDQKGIDLDYLPHFTTKGPIVMIPEDRYISVVKDWFEISRLDASLCTRQSKLYTCNSGILLLENNILYLLNTK